MRRIKKQIMRYGFLFPAIFLVLTACITIGHEFPVNEVYKIRTGETTREEINQLFGKPWRTGLDDGMKTWTYGHYKYSVLGSSKTRDLVVRFNEQGIVTSYTFNSTYPEDEQH